MRLKKIKLAGFKSFVDPTTVPIEKNLVGIVGPNGCGKSNVIDAVRWVMGESSAKNLRGDSLTDVIFNGSSNRKPVGQASIELVFDNTNSTLTGEYSTYSEISIKRVINREAQSTYYLNNSRCRRKDLADVFLGTGLGPRSYSIIEQGMISRIIEAKPEELRLYLEEAAGISKYKERRQETENRIKHARENLDRVNDIRQELAKQIEKLAKQAEVAEQYKILKQEFALQEKYDFGLQHKKLQVDYNSISSEVNLCSLALEEFNTQTQSYNTSLEHKKIAVSQFLHEQQEEQAKFYKIEQNISVTEQDIKHYDSEKQHCEQSLSNTSKQLEICINNRHAKNAELERLVTDLAKIEPEFSELLEIKNEKQSRLENTEELYSNWQHDWAKHQEVEHNNSKIISQNQAVIEKHDTLIVRTQKRIDILKQEQQQLKLHDDSREIKELKAKYAQGLDLNNKKQQELNEVISSYKSLEQTITQLQHRLDSCNKENQTQKGRLSSLETLQEHDLGKDQKKLNEWLESNNLNDAKRLGEVINIESGWEKALETILRDYIKAIIISEDSNFDLLNLSEQDINLIAKFDTAFINNHSDHNIKSNTQFNNQLNKKELLINKIKAPQEICHLLNNIYCAEDLNAAKAMLPNLKFGDSVITKNGCWLNNNWFALGENNDAAKQSIISRAAEIKGIQHNLKKLEAELSEIRSELTESKEQLNQYAEDRDSLQQELRALLTEQSGISSNLSRLESKADEQRHRSLRIEQDLMEAVKHVEVDSAAVKQERAKLETAMSLMDEFATNRIKLQSLGDNLKQELAHIRSEYEQTKDQIHKLELTIQKLKQAIKHLQDEIALLDNQQLRLQYEQTSLGEKSLLLDEPIYAIKEKLAELLKDKQLQADKLSSKNQEYESANEELNQIERKLSDLRKEHDNLRDKLETVKLKQHETKTKLETLNETLLEKCIQIAELTDNLPSDLQHATVKSRLKELKQAIEDLGAVNLTAIDEYQVEYQRKTYLDAQEADLQEALSALESAIKQIDEETKQRFKDTYDFVNEQFQYLFPKVFGGGRASLNLVGSDLLDTGLTVMAQPPGKRNASIHLLSGGEKALTAIALVFSIFRLNPAPFCMLDEVDAPLDDANVGRYCNLVKEMSRDIQFIFITHNKLAMTMAEHLMGVTMHEPGVSRLVAVDVDEAVTLANA